MKKEDTIYADKIDNIKPFEFNKKVVEVFSDMITRSVPLYKEMIYREAMLTRQFYQKDTMIYDLGCSNGNFGIELLNQMGKTPFKMVAVDSSRDMIETYHKRLSKKPLGSSIQAICEFLENIEIQNASVVVINLTLQFLPLTLRDSIIRKIYDGLNKKGILLLSEKTIHSSESFTNLQQDLYYRFKKENGYSNMEISQKRDALDNVLIPETVETHLNRFEESGFKCHDVWLKWFNFTSFICQK